MKPKAGDLTQYVIYEVMKDDTLELRQCASIRYLGEPEARRVALNTIREIEKRGGNVALAETRIVSR